MRQPFPDRRRAIGVHPVATDRAAVPAVATLVLLLTVVVTAAALGVLAVGITDSVPDRPDVTTVGADPIDVSADGRTIHVEHTGPESIDTDAVRIEIEIDGTPLAIQPPVPFFSATGFEPGPSGPFNVASDSEWAPGETGSLTIAATNEPLPGPGSTVRVTVYVDGVPYGSDTDRA